MGRDKNPETEYEGGSTHEGWKMGRRRGFGSKQGKVLPHHMQGDVHRTYRVREKLRRGRSIKKQQNASQD